MRDGFLVHVAMVAAVLVSIVPAAFSSLDPLPISFVVKEGHASVAIPVLDVASSDIGTYEFVVTKGEGEFAATGRRAHRARIEGRDLIVPSLRPGPLLRESFVALYRDGRVLLENLRFVTVPSEVFEVLHSQVQEGEAGVLFRGQTMVVVDESIWVEADPDIDIPRDLVIEAPVPEGFDIEREPSGKPGEPDTQLPDYPGGGDDDGEVDRCPTRTCTGSNPLTAGVVKWYVPDPVASGFTYKPETVSNQLACPTVPADAVDGVYRVKWGCSIALKIPNNCVASLFDTEGSCCCGDLALFGKICEYIDPTQLPDWPNCYGHCVSAS